MNKCVLLIFFALEAIMGNINGMDDIEGSDSALVKAIEEFMRLNVTTEYQCDRLCNKVKEFKQKKKYKNTFNNVAVVATNPFYFSSHPRHPNVPCEQFPYEEVSSEERSMLLVKIAQILHYNITNLINQNVWSYYGYLYVDRALTEEEKRRLSEESRVIVGYYNKLNKNLLSERRNEGDLVLDGIFENKNIFMYVNKAPKRLMLESSGDDIGKEDFFEDKLEFRRRPKKQKFVTKVTGNKRCNTSEDDDSNGRKKILSPTPRVMQNGGELILSRPKKPRLE